MKKKIGMLTVGQSPRIDIIPNMKQIIGDQATLLERGALDNLSRAEIENLAPKKGMTAIVSRLADGSSVVVAKEALLARIQTQINALNQEDVDLIALLCTGHLPGFESRCLLLESQKVVLGWVQTLLHGQGTLGVLVPLPDQIEAAHQTFAHTTAKTVVTDATPYGSVDEIAHAAEFFKNNNVDLILMNCMGYRNAHRSALNAVYAKPVLLSHAMVARTIAEITQM